MRLRVSILRAASILAVVYTAAIPSISAQEVVADYSWAFENLEECANRLLGAHNKLVSASFSSKTFATVRVLEDSCGERQISVMIGPGDIIEVQTAQVTGNPILEQLYTLHEAAPEEEADRLCRKIPVVFGSIQGDSSKDIRASVDELYKRDFSLLPRSLAVVHGVTYSIWITSGQWDIYFSFSDTHDPTTRHHLATWAEGLLTAARLTCDSELPRSGQGSWRLRLLNQRDERATPDGAGEEAKELLAAPSSESIAQAREKVEDARRELEKQVRREREELPRREDTMLGGKVLELAQGEMEGAVQLCRTATRRFVEAEVELDTAGRVQSVELRTASGDQRCDDALIRALQGSRWVSCQDLGEPAPCRVSYALSLGSPLHQG